MDSGTTSLDSKRVWIRKATLRQRWDIGANSTFHDWLSKGLIPQPEYPFGPHTPFWRLTTIEAFERNAQGVAA